MPKVRRRGEYRQLNNYEDHTLRPPEGVGWAWLTAELLESKAFRTLSLSARRVVDRLMVEHIRQGGQENGRLAVSYDALEAFGVDRKRIRPALAELDQHGVVKLSVPGRRPYGIDPGRVATYRLTFLGVIGDHPQAGPARNEWKAYEASTRAKHHAAPRARPTLRLVTAA